MRVYSEHDWGPDFEMTVAATLLQDEELYVRFRSIIRDEVFLSPALRLTFRAQGAYYDSYRQAPTREVLKEIIRRTGHPRASEAIEWLDALLPIGDLNYVVDRILEWAKWSAIDTVVSTVNGEDPTAFARRIEAASRMGDEATLSHVTLAADDQWVDQHRPVVPTPWVWLNDRFPAGGPEYQDLCIFLAFVNTGKTTALVNVAASAVLAGMQVVYLTFEDGEKKIKRRMVQRLTGSTLQDMLNDKSEVSRRKEAALGAGGDVHIKQMKNRRSTVDDAMAFVRTIQDSTERKVDLVISDYADRFRPPVKTDEPRHAWRAIYEDCKYLATEMDCVHWTASQVQREVAGREKVKLENVAEAIGKVESADVVIGLGQSKEDAARDEISLYTAKMRDGKKGELLKIGVDFERQLIEEYD